MTRIDRWVSFLDEENTTWLFDLSFLTSDWSCTFGTGCPGIESSGGEARGCCIHGAHLIDEDERLTLIDLAALLGPDVWQNRTLVATEHDLFDEVDGAVVTATHDDACIFLNGPDFEGGQGCALHVAALKAGKRPIDWKPTVCWQVPFRLEEYQDGAGTTTVVVRAWRRSDWGEGGADFAHWCTDQLTPAATLSATVLENHVDELVEIVGEWPVDQLRAWVASRSRGETSVELPAAR